MNPRTSSVRTMLTSSGLIPEARTIRIQATCHDKEQPLAQQAVLMF